jgi:hypothetical protein
MAVTEESTSAKADREAGAKIETPARRQLTEVPSRAARVKDVLGQVLYLPRSHVW